MIVNSKTHLLQKSFMDVFIIDMGFTNGIFYGRSVYIP